MYLVHTWRKCKLRNHNSFQTIARAVSPDIKSACPFLSTTLIMDEHIVNSPAHARFRRTFSVAALRKKLAPALAQSASAPNITVSSNTTMLTSPASMQASTLSPSLSSAIDAALTNAWSNGTRAIQRTAMKKFFSFCDANGIAQADRLPSSELLLCAFIATCTTVAPSTLRNYISGIRAYHIQQGLTWLGSTRLQYVREGMSKSPAALSRIKPPRPPVTRVMLHKLHDRLDASKPFDACVLACADVAFWGQTRLGELLLEAPSPCPAKLPVPSPMEVTETALNTIELQLPYTKVKKWSGEKTTLTHQIGTSDPIVALLHHLSLNHVPIGMPLFSFASQSNVFTIMTKGLFLRTCNVVWSAANLPRYTGHSFRIGGTTALLLGGVHPDLVKEMGRWSGDSYLRYWREFHQLIPLNATNIPLVPTPSSSNLNGPSHRGGARAHAPAAAASPGSAGVPRARRGAPQAARGAEGAAVQPPRGSFGPP